MDHDPVPELLDGGLVLDLDLEQTGLPLGVLVVVTCHALFQGVQVGLAVVQRRFHVLELLL